MKEEALEVAWVVVGSATVATAMEQSAVAAMAVAAASWEAAATALVVVAGPPDGHGSSHL